MTTSSYLSASELSAITGLSARYFQRLKGRVPWASQPEEGGPILFERAGFEAWLAAGKPKVTTWGSTGGKGGRGRGRKSVGRTIAAPLAHDLNARLKQLTGSGSRG